MVRHLNAIGVAWLLFLLLMTSASAYAANIEATVDRSVVQENESLNLILTADTEVDDPDLRVLENDFQILSRSQSSNISILNGQVNRQIKWEFMLMPKRSGDLTIPGIAFGKDRSNPVEIKVSPASVSAGSIANDLVYLEASVDNPSVYVQAQLVYTLRIYHAVQLRNASLNDLEISDSDAVIEKLSENKTFEKMINGRRYRVYEKQFVIFPQNAGTLEIKPAVLDAQYIDLPRVLRNKRLVSETIKVTVNPVPPKARQAQTAYWLPARSLALTEEWSNTAREIKVGDPITRTLLLTASGLMSAQLPVLGGADAGAAIKQYADQPVLENTLSDTGFAGKRQEKIAYIPTQPGRMTLPAIEMVWWNTEKDRLETATLPARTIKVAGVTGQEAPIAGQPAPDVAGATGQDPTGKVTQTSTADTPASGLSSSLWFGISVALFIVWLLTLSTWYATLRRRRAPGVIVPNQGHGGQTIKELLQQVKAACEANDPQRVKNALLEWGFQQWPDQRPTSLGHIAQRVNGQLASELLQLSALLYKPDLICSPELICNPDLSKAETTPDAARWNSKGLWQALLEYTENNRHHATPPASGIIPPLYRIAQAGGDQSHHA